MSKGPRRPRNPFLDSNYLRRPHLAESMREYLKQNVLIVLKPPQLNILGQVFRPLFCGKIRELSDEYLLLENVNIKMSNAPELSFPHP